MASIGSLRVELELDDGSFTTRVIRVGTSLADLNRQTGQTVTAVRRLDSTFSDVGESIRGAILTIGLARAAIENIYSVFGAWATSIVKAGAELERITTLMRGFSKETDAAARSIDADRSTQWILNLSQRAPFALKNLTEAFATLKSAGIDPTKGALDGLVNAVAAAGGSSEVLGRAAVAIQQMAGKGVISMEELRQQLGEAVPQAMTLMARSMGMTMSELTKQVSNGAVKAIPALTAMIDEFNRAFGGSTTALMNTFNGQLNILTTNFTRLQQVAAGKQGDGGFLDQTTQAVRRLNEVLSSPEARTGAIVLGRNMASLVQGLVGLAEWAARNAQLLINLGAAAAGLIAFSTARRLISFIVTDLALMAIQLSTVAARFGLVARAQTAWVAVQAGISVGYAALGTFQLAVANLTRVIILQTSIMGFWSTALMGARAAIVAIGSATGITALVTSVVSFTSTLVLSVRMIGFWSTALLGVQMAGAAFMGAMRGIGAAVQTMIASMQAGIATVGLLRAALIALASATIIGAGIQLIMLAVDYLIRKYDQLFGSADRAYNRIKQGANDDTTISEARDDLKTMEDRLALLTKMRDQVREVKVDRNGDMFKGWLTGGITAPAVETKSLGGTADIPSIRDGQLTRDELVAREKMLNDQIEAIQRERVNRTAVIDGAERAQRIQNADRVADGILNALQASNEVARANYQQEANRLWEELGKAGETGSRELQDRLRKSLQDSLRANTVSFETDTLNRVKAEIARQTELLNSRDQATVLTASKVIERLNGEVDLIQARIARAESDIRGAAIGLKSGEQDSLDKQAATLIRNTTTRIAELNGEMEKTGSNAQKLQAMFAENAGLGRFGNISDETKQKLIDLMNALDAAEQRKKEFQAAASAQQKIETGAAQAAAELQAMTDKLQNPELADGSNKVAQFSRMMQAALETLKLRLGETSAEFIALSNTVNQAIANMKQSVAMDNINSFIQAGQRALEQNQTPAQQAAATRARLGTQRDQAREAAGAIQDATQRAAKLAEIDKAYENQTANVGRRFENRVAGAAKKGENEVTGLQSRLAELRAEMTSGNTEVAKWTVKLGAGLNTARGQEVIGLARQIDAATKALEKFREATSAFDELKRAANDSNGAVAELRELLADPNNTEGVNQLISARRQLQAQLNKVNEGLPAGDPRRAEAAKNMQDAYSLKAQELAMKAELAQRNETRSILAGLETTNAGRRRAAMESLQIEQQGAQRLIDVSNMTVEDRKKAQDDLTAYIAAKEQQIARQTEGAAAQTAREWANLADNIENAFVSAIDSSLDTLIDFVTTGKASFTDLANSILKDIARIALRSALSGLVGSIGTALGAAFGGGVSTLGGVDASSKAYSASVNNTNPNAFGPGFHSGGIVGQEATFLRSLQKFHTGGMIGNDEKVIITKNGEGVFTQGQMDKIGEMNHAYTAVEQAMSMIADKNLSAKSAVNVAPAAQAPAFTQAPVASPVSINLNNQSGQSLNATAGTPRFDGEQMVLDVVISNMQRPGRLRDAMKSR